MSTHFVASMQRKSKSLESMNQLQKMNRKRCYSDYSSEEYEPQAKWAHLEEPSPSNEVFIELPLSETTTEEIVESVTVDGDQEEIQAEQKVQTVFTSLAEEIHNGEPNTSSYDEKQVQTGFVFPGTSINVIGTLGKGAFGKVVEMYSNGSTKAMKFVKNISAVEKANNAKEVRILSTIAADRDKEVFFVRFFESFEYGNSMVFVMEKMDMDLQAYMKENRFQMLAPDVVLYLAKQIFNGLSELWNLGFAHADAKPNNILLVDSDDEENPWRIKIADFGNSIPVERISRLTNFQAPVYRAPELHISHPGNDTVDTWSAGATVFFLYTGEKLFTGMNTHEILRQVHENTPLWYLTEQQEAELLKIEPRDRVYTERGFDKLVEYGYNFLIKDVVTADDLEVAELMNEIMQPDPKKRPTPNQAFEFLMARPEEV